MTYLRRILLALLITSTVILGPVPPVSPARADSDAQIRTPAISFKQVGLDDVVDIVGANQTTEMQLPVPVGIRPGHLTGQIGTLVNAQAGRVDVLDARGVLLASIPAPTATTAPFDVDIAAAQVTNNRAAIRLVLRDTTTDHGALTACTAVPAVTLSQLAVTYSGALPYPRAVADFLPGYLDEIHIQVGTQPTDAQQQAALDLVAKLTALYRPIPVRIGVDAGAGAPPIGLSRVIEIRDGGKPGLLVQDAGTPAAVLVITGTGHELSNQVKLYTDQRVALAQMPTAAVTSASVKLAPSVSTLTFGQLGMSGQTSVLGTSTLYTGFDAAAFGVGRVDGVSLHLIANYTPVKAGEASLVVKSGSAVIGSRLLDASGVMDLRAEVPVQEISSHIGLALEVRYIPAQQCGPQTDRLTFALDPRSTITVHTGHSDRGGFPSLPAAMTPEMEVALSSPDQIRYAAQALNLMGQQSPAPLRTHVVPLEQAAHSQAPLLVVATGERLSANGLTPPLLPGGSSNVAIHADVSTDVDLSGPVGIIEAFTTGAEGGRPVLAITAAGDWTLVDRDFQYIRGLDTRWTSLTGDVVATGPACNPVNLVVASGGPIQYIPMVPEGWRWWTWLTVAAGLAIVAGAGAFAFVRSRRRSTTRS